MTNSMSCEQFGNQLLSYLEHEVDDATRAAIERHSVTCADCGALLADLRKLRIDAANLPTLQPSRDLWSGIASRIEAPVLDIGTAREVTRRPTRLRPWMRGAMLAASLVAAAGIGYVSRGTQDQVMPAVADQIDSLPAVAVLPDSVPSATPSVPNAMSGGNTPRAESREPRAVVSPEVQTVLASLTADYDREIARLRTLIEQRRNQLDPVTVAVIETNLKVIDTAVEDCKKAIVRDPASRFLIESLNQSLQSKVELMRTAALLPSRT